MSKIRLKEFENDAVADQAVSGVASSLTKLASAVTNVKDYSRVIEAIMKWLKTKKGSQLSGLDTNPNYKLIMTYLNKMQSDLDDEQKKDQKPVTQEK